jgi:esterase/lipase
MNSKIRCAIVAAVVGALLAPLAFAEVTPKDIFKQCQANANEEMIPLGQLQQYLRQCMEDAGIDAAIVDDTMKEMMPAPDNTEENQPAAGESRT